VSCIRSRCLVYAVGVLYPLSRMFSKALVGSVFQAFRTNTWWYGLQYWPSTTYLSRCKACQMKRFSGQLSAWDRPKSSTNDRRGLDRTMRRLRLAVYMDYEGR